MYVYKITVTVSIDAIKMECKDELLTWLSDYNSNVLNEHFYYGYDNKSHGFITTYDTDIVMNDDLTSYKLSHLLYNRKKTLLNEFIEMYDKEDFLLSNIDEYSGDNIIDLPSININMEQLNNKIVDCVTSVQSYKKYFGYKYNE